jgi:glutaredoxin
VLLEAARWLVGRVVLGVEAVTMPTPPERTPGAQARVDALTAGLALYQFRACPFCVRVRHAMRRMGLDIELRDARGDPATAAELRQGGGRYQVPCLRIEENGGVEWLYESADIIAWLEQRFARF